MTAPCKDCPDRHELCHAHCEKYIAYRQERDAYLKTRHEEGAIEYTHIHKLDGMRRAYVLKRKRKGK